MLDSAARGEYEAALLVIIHSGITANWLLKRNRAAAGVENPAQEKLALLSTLYQRLLADLRGGQEGRRPHRRSADARDARKMRGVPRPAQPRGAERKLISFVFFGCQEDESRT